MAEATIDSTDSVSRPGTQSIRVGPVVVHGVRLAGLLRDESDHFKLSTVIGG